MIQRTLSIIKPDGVSRNIIGEIVTRLEQEGLKIIAMKLMHMTKRQDQGFYKVHEDKPFFNSLTDFMSSGPCVVMVLESENTIEKYRRIMGATDFRKAEEGTIRKLYATDIEHNIVHGPDAPKTAEFEINYFFNAFEMAD